MKFSKKRKKDCMRLQLWAQDNMADWLTICGVYQKISKAEYCRLERLLYENNFDYIVLVLFTIHNYVFNEDDGDFRMVIMDMLIRVCKNKGIKLSKYPSFEEIMKKMNMSEETKNKILKEWNSLAVKDENKKS